MIIHETVPLALAGEQPCQPCQMGALSALPSTALIGSRASKARNQSRAAVFGGSFMGRPGGGHDLNKATLRCKLCQFVMCQKCAGNYCHGKQKAWLVTSKDDKISEMVEKGKLS